MLPTPLTTWLSINASLIGERRIERLRTQRVQQRVSVRRRCDPQHRAESPRIVIAQQRAVVEYDIDMVVRPAGRRVAEDAERSRHADVNEQGRSTCVKQQILAAAID